MSDAEIETVLETFDGYVDSIDGDTAHVTLEGRENGDVLYGVYSAAKLAAREIYEQSRFECRTVKVSDAIRLDLEALPDIEVSEEEAHAIEKEMREAFPGDDSSIEY